jgi:hypothetical protein
MSFGMPSLLSPLSFERPLPMRNSTTTLRPFLGYSGRVFVIDLGQSIWINMFGASPSW